MAKLDEILKSINEDLINLQVKSDLESLRILNEYMDHNILKHFDAPRFTINGINLNLKFTVSEVNESTIYDFSDTRKKWLAIISKIPADYLKFLKDRWEDHSTSVKTLILEYIKQIPGPEFDIKNYLLRKEDLVKISGNLSGYIIKLFKFLPEDQRFMLPYGIENIIQQDIINALSNIEEYSSLNSTLDELSLEVGEYWLKELKNKSNSLADIKNIHSLTENEKNKIKRDVTEASMKVEKIDFFMAEVLQDKTDKIKAGSEFYFDHLIVQLPADIKTIIKPEEIKNELESYITSNMSLNLQDLKNIARKVISDEIVKKWPNLLKEKLTGFLDKPIIQLNPNEKRRLSRIYESSYKFNIAPLLSLENVLKNNTTRVDLSNSIDFIFNIFISPDFKISISKAKVTEELNLNDVLKGVLPEIKSEAILAVEKEWKSILIKFISEKIQNRIDESGKEAIKKEILAVINSISLPGINQIVRKALLGSTKDLFDNSVLLLTNIPEQLKSSSKARIKANVFTDINVRGLLMVIYNSIGFREFQTGVDKLFHDFNTSWNSKLANIALDVTSKAFAPYAELSLDMEKILNALISDQGSLSVSDDDLKKATEENKWDFLFERTANYILVLMRKLPMDNEILSKLPMAFSEKSFFKNQISKLFTNNIQNELQNSVGRRVELSKLDINIKNQDVEASKVINEINIELKPNFIKIIKDE